MSCSFGVKVVCPKQLGRSLCLGCIGILDREPTERNNALLVQWFAIGMLSWPYY